MTGIETLISPTNRSKRYRWGSYASLDKILKINNASGIAEAYRYLAEVAFARNQWETVINFTQKAMGSKQDSLSRVYFLQAKAQAELKQFTNAVESLETAKEICLQCLSSSGKDESISVFNTRKIHEELYLDILDNLQKFYFNHLKEYRKAFDLKQGIIEAKQRFGQYAFIGANRIKGTQLQGQVSWSIAPEIIASGREKDVEKLVEKIIKKEHKVIVIYGESGVGKSSLVSGGLVPSLQARIVSEGKILPIYLRVYSDWLAELERQLRENLPSFPNSVSQNEEKGNMEKVILDVLQQCQERHRVVLIFDQFEEFFFEKTTTKEQHDFFQFLGECLKILSLKLVFCLRKDYLHYLVDVPGMESISSDVLRKDNLYTIGDFEPQETKGIIQRLTQQSQFKLDEDLKELLIEQYLYGVVQACGEENEEVGNLILYFLTDEKGTRPLKTRKELLRELTENKAFTQALTIEESQLDLILGILVKSGLVVLIPAQPDERYQLLHDYLTSFIRNKQTPNIENLVAKYEGEKAQRQALEKSLQQIQKEIEALETTKQELQTKNGQANIWVKVSSIAAGLLLTAAVGSGYWAK